jgi:Fe-S cluster biogenesis protein NfuA
MGAATGDYNYIPTQPVGILHSRDSMDIFDRIERTLDTLRPYIASHRGHVEVVDFDEQEGVLLLRLGGTCHGCSASSVTLKQGIESRLREMVPEVKHVEAV